MTSLGRRFEKTISAPYVGLVPCTGEAMFISGDDAPDEHTNPGHTLGPINT